MAVDERVRVAIENWAPRFIANGVDANDFQRVIQHVERWDDWSREWSVSGDMHANMGEEAEVNGYYESAGYHYLHAVMAYHFGKFVFVQRPQELRTAHHKVVQTYQRALPYFDFPGERVAIPYEAGKTIPGILRKPWHTPKPPVVILLPGLDSVKEELHMYGDDFLRRGMAVLAIDGPGQGEMEFEYALRHDSEVTIGSTIDYLETRMDVDAARTGLLGVSLGGYFAPRAAAFEHRIQATISLSGAYNFAENFEHLPILTKEAFVHRLKVANKEEAHTKLEKFNLAGVLHNIQCPLLVIMGRRDRLIAPEQAERMAAEAGGQADLWMFEDGNHVCNNITYKHRPQQADWMRKILLREQSKNKIITT